VVIQGDNLRTRICLVPKDDGEKFDVTLNYSIKDYMGNIYLIKKETFLVEEQMSFEEDFDTEHLPLGDYIVGLELTYSEEIVTSSAHFKVIKPEILADVWIMIATIGLIVVLIIVVYLGRNKEWK